MPSQSAPKQQPSPAQILGKKRNDGFAEPRGQQKSSPPPGSSKVVTYAKATAGRVDTPSAFSPSLTSPSQRSLPDDSLAGGEGIENSAYTFNSSSSLKTPSTPLNALKEIDLSFSNLSIIADGEGSVRSTDSIQLDQASGTRISGPDLPLRNPLAPPKTQKEPRLRSDGSAKNDLKNDALKKESSGYSSHSPSPVAPAEKQNFGSSGMADGSSGTTLASGSQEIVAQESSNIEEHPSSPPPKMNLSGVAEGAPHPPTQPPLFSWNINPNAVKNASKFTIPQKTHTLPPLTGTMRMTGTRIDGIINSRSGPAGSNLTAAGGYGSTSSAPNDQLQVQSVTPAFGSVTSGGTEFTFGSKTGPGLDLSSISETKFTFGRSAEERFGSIISGEADFAFVVTAGSSLDTSSLTESKFIFGKSAEDRLGNIKSGGAEFTFGTKSGSEFDVSGLTGTNFAFGSIVSGEVGLTFGEPAAANLGSSSFGGTSSSYGAFGSGILDSTSFGFEPKSLGARSNGASYQTHPAPIVKQESQEVEGMNSSSSGQERKLKSPSKSTIPGLQFGTFARRSCGVCYEKPAFKCESCEHEAYCSVAHQQQDWAKHQPDCWK